MIGTGKIVMCGCCDFGLHILEYLYRKGITISHIVTLTPEQAEKYKVSGYADFKPISARLKIPIYYAREYSLKSHSDQQFFEKEKFDVLITGGWQRLIPEDILASLRVGGLGIHGSSDFLPKGRGRSPINWSLIQGRKRFIVHLFLMKPDADDGDIIGFEFFDINEFDSCNTLYIKLGLVTSRLLSHRIPKIINGTFKKIPQSGIPSYYPKRTPAEGLIDWSKDLHEIYNFIRALTHPYPGAFSYIKKHRINIWKAQPFDTRIDDPDWQTGEIIHIVDSKSFVVKCSGGLLLITEYELTGDLKLEEHLSFDVAG